MKKFILILMVMCGYFSGKAQDKNNTRAEKIQALKIAFITQRLQLTTDEAQKFWPVYDEYEREIHTLQIESKGGDVIESEEKLLNIRKKYKPAFEKVIGPQKLNKLFNAEKDFRTILIRRLKNHDQQRLNQQRR